MSLEIIKTGDGSHSLLNTQLNETYHSTHGALQESLYVFIQQGFEHLSQPAVKILEVGFGTGLNAWLTRQHAKKTKQQIEYTTLETYPLPAEVWKALNYVPSREEQNDFFQLHESTWNEAVQLTSFFTLTKLNVSLHSAVLPHNFFDLIYFDAFAPNKQPDMWTADVLARVVASMSQGGVFVTYCAQGQLKRNLKSLGLSVESLPGPPGKREMVRAQKV